MEKLSHSCMSYCIYNCEHINNVHCIFPEHDKHSRFLPILQELLPSAKLNQEEEGHKLEEDRRRKISGQGDITAKVKSGRSDGRIARDF